MKDKLEQFEFDGELDIVEKEETSTPEDATTDASTEQSAEEPYSGPERRNEHRRKGGDRRQDIRFEPEKDDRRSGKDRRRGVWDGKYTV